MPDVPVGQRNVYKDDAVEAIDAFFSGDAMQLAQAFDVARGILGDANQSLADAIASGSPLDLSPEQVQHFRTHWPAAVQDEMRRGYTEAINLAARSPQLPIETFWVTGPSAAFQIFARREAGARQVTVLVFIPPGLERAAREGWPAA
jgi:hypothetical protein